MSAYSDLVIADGAVGYWRLGETTGTTAADSAGTNPGTYSGGVTLGVAGLLVDGQDTAVQFNGTTGIVTIVDAASLDLGNGPLSFEFGFRRIGGHGTRQYLVSKASQGQIDLDASNKIAMDQDGGISVTSTTSFPATDLQSHHVVCVHDIGAVKQNKIYIDGIEEGVTGVNNTYASNANPLVLGAYFASSDFASVILDEVSYYNVALTQAQDTAHYRAWLTGSRFAVARKNRRLPRTRRLAFLRRNDVTGTPQLVTVPTASLTLTPFAPTVSAPRLVTIGKASLVLTTFAPVVSAPRLVTIGKASLVISTLAPTAAAPRLATIGKASLVLTAFTPTVAAPRLVTVGKASLVLTSFAPVVAVPRLATIGKASLVLTALAPTVAAPRLVTVGKASLALTAFAPVVAAPRLVTPVTASLTLTRFAPTALTTRLVTIGKAALVLTSFAPIVTASASRTVTPGVAALSLVPYAPTVTGQATVAGGGSKGRYQRMTRSGQAFEPPKVRPQPVRQLHPVAVSPRSARLRLITYEPSITINDDDLVFLLETA